MANFNDYSTTAYGRMIEDKRRTAPFVAALREAIRPGSIVLDIGTGTGIFSFLACELGAARVYALEPDATALEVARRCALDIPGSERITWIQDLSTKIDLPEPVDVVVGDLHGVLPFFKGNIESMADAFVRHLTAGGRLIPARDFLYAAPAYSPEEYLQVERPWRSNDHGIDLSAAASYVVNRWWRARSEPVQPERLLAQPAQWGVVDYSNPGSANLDATLSWAIERDGLLHGFYVWFEGDLGGGIGYSNAPTLPELIYGRAFFPLERPVEACEGDVVSVRLTARQVKGEYVFRWDTTVQSAHNECKAAFRQSTFKATLPPAGNLHKASPDYRPTLNDDGLMLRAALEAMGAGESLQRIANQLESRFPHRFATEQAALDEVVRLVQRYG